MASSRACRSNSSSSAAEPRRVAWPPSAATVSGRARDSRPRARSSNRLPAGPFRPTPATAAATDRSAAPAMPPGPSRSRACRARSAAIRAVSASEARDVRVGPAQARLNTRRAMIGGSQANAFHLPNSRRHSSTRRSASAAPSGPTAIRSGSQSNRCRASAKARVGLGRSQGSPPAPTAKVAPARVKAPARTRRPASGSDGRKSRGCRAKPSGAGRALSQRCGSDPRHSSEIARPVATSTASAMWRPGIRRSAASAAIPRRYPRRAAMLAA